MVPDAATLAELEKETLRTIRKIGLFADFSDIWNTAMKFANAIHGGNVNAHFSLNIDLGLRTDKGVPVKRRVTLSALVIPSALDKGKSIASASYSLVISDGLDPATCAVLRKIHFDYEAASARNHAEPKPSTHMQICGTFSGHHHQAGYRDEQLEAWFPALEKPRVPVQPTCLALLINWVLLEFGTDNVAARILKDSQWRALVRKAERAVLKPYFDSAASFLGAAAEEELSFFDVKLYELPQTQR